MKAERRRNRAEIAKKERLKAVAAAAEREKQEQGEHSKSLFSTEFFFV